MERITWPELSYPFPPVINEHADEVHAETVEWARSFSLISGESGYGRVRETNIGRLAGRFHPDAPREKLRLISDWYAWMFFRDDLCDESEIGRRPHLVAAGDLRYLDILRGGGDDERLEENSLCLAMHDLRRRLLPLVPAALWMRRFARSVKEHFDSTLWESMNRARGATPNLQTYIRMRPITGGMHVDADFIEIATDIYLPTEVHGHRTVSALTRMSNNAVCWANDLISLPKELASGDVHNIVLVLQKERDLPLEEAMDAAIGMHDSEVSDFLDLADSLPGFGPAVDENVRRYVSVLRARMRGNLDWSFESARYRTDSPL